MINKTKKNYKKQTGDRLETSNKPRNSFTKKLWGKKPNIINQNSNKFSMFLLAD